MLGREPTTFALFRETKIGGANVDLAAADDLAHWVKLEQREAAAHVHAGRGARSSSSPGVARSRAGSSASAQGSLVSQQPFGYLLGQADGRLDHRAGDAVAPAGGSPVPAGARRGERGAGCHSCSTTTAATAGSSRSSRATSTRGTLGRVDRTLAEAGSAVGTVSSAFTVEAPQQDLQEFRATGQAGQRRLLLLGGEAAALLLAFVILAASGLRRDAEASRRRLTWLGATRSQIALQSGTEAAAVAAAGTAVGWFAGIVPALAVAGSLRIAGARRSSCIRSFPEPAWPLRSRSSSPPPRSCSPRVWAPRVQLGGLRFTALDFAAAAAAVVVAVAFARGATDTGSLAGGQGTGAVLLLLPGLVVFIAAVLAARAVGFVSKLLERAGRRGALPAPAGRPLARAQSWPGRGRRVVPRRQPRPRRSSQRSTARH